jgi:toxin ParE1/3/4
MVAKPLEIHPGALEEMKSTVGWYLERSEPAAHEFVEEVDRAIALILESPGRWPTADHGTRRLVLRRFPFAIHYREKESGVQILAVAHGHRHPGYWKGRL